CCTIDGARAPRAASLIVGLTTGRAPFQDPTSGKVVRREYRSRTWRRPVQCTRLDEPATARRSSASPDTRSHIRENTKDWRKLFVARQPAAHARPHETEDDETCICRPTCTRHQGGQPRPSSYW